jgi:hypothetical protein
VAVGLARGTLVDIAAFLSIEEVALDAWVARREMKRIEYRGTEVIEACGVWCPGLAMRAERDRERERKREKDGARGGGRQGASKRGERQRHRSGDRVAAGKEERERHEERKREIESHRPPQAANQIFVAKLVAPDADPPNLTVPTLSLG